MIIEFIVGSVDVGEVSFVLSQHTLQHPTLNPRPLINETLNIFLGFGAFQTRLFFFIGLSFSCHAMQITLLVFIEGCIQVEYGLSNSLESLLTSVVFAGIKET